MRDNEQILNYEISGRGPVVVLLHGYLSSLRYWDTLRISLEKDHTVVAIDLLGFGNSPKPKKDAYGYDDHIGWIKRTLDHCGIHEPVLLAGHSMGALLALRYGSEYPESVRSLLLMNTPLFKNAQEARRELASTNLFFRASLYWELHRLICPIMRNAAMKMILRRALPLQYKGMETYIFSSSAEARNRSLKNIIEAQHGMFELKHLSIPATLIAGKKERPAYLENLRYVSQTQNLKILLTDTGHHTPLENQALSSLLMQSL
jgi:pimeloyl-ACP methyl ester carboxylesterase